MFDLFRLWLGAVLRGFRTRRSLMLENLALRQQLAVFKRQQPRPRLGAIDKLFWVVARRFWAHWEKALLIVLPDSVARWHRAGFKLYWAMTYRLNHERGGKHGVIQEPYWMVPLKATLAMLATLGTLGVLATWL